MGTFISDLSNREYPEKDQVSARLVRKPILDLICKDYPQFTTDCKLAISELNVYRQKYVASFLAKELGELTQLEETVLGSMQSKQTLVEKIEDAQEDLTTGQRLADRVASFGGSWKFIISFAVFITFWIGVNALAYAFDAYPFILLNLILSCVAALQAPIIMMSQNRQEEKDRSRAKKDYMINLKSELEIRMVHEKLDHLIMHQQQELIEIQKVQIEMMNDIMARLSEKQS